MILAYNFLYLHCFCLVLVSGWLWPHKMSCKCSFLCDCFWKSFRKIGINSSLKVWWEKAMPTHSSTLAWKIPWMEEPGRLQSMESLRAGHNWVPSLSLFTFMRWRRKWQPIPSVLAWRIPWTEKPGRLQSMGSQFRDIERPFSNHIFLVYLALSTVHPFQLFLNIPHA